jgi:hypothetical protein
MPREVTDNENITWSCIEAYAGLSETSNDAAQAAQKGDTRIVVCTPSGGARSVRLQLPADWENALDDQTLLQHIAQQQNAGNAGEAIK